MTVHKEGWSKRRALALWGITLGVIVLVAAIGTIVLYVLDVLTAYALLISTVVVALSSVVALVIVNRRYDRASRDEHDL